MNIVFICTHNTNRSPMAQAWAHLLGGKQVRAFSAGAQPARAVHALAIASMRELGFDLGAHVPQSLEALPDIVFDAVISMGSAPSGGHLRAKHHESWAIPDSRSLPEAQFRAVRNLIGWRVYDLLLDLGLEPIRSVLPFAKP